MKSPELRPLFIPLRSEYFEAFERGVKTTEFRPYGPRWNGDTCCPGRKVVLSCGYGKSRRLNGRVVSFTTSALPTTTTAWRDCYGDRGGVAACIEIELEAR